MTHITYVQGIADRAWASLRAHAIAPTPRHYEIWYTYCADEKAALTKQLDGLLRSDQPITPGLLDKMYQTFFVTAVDVAAVRDGSHQLQQIATELAERVSADRAVVDDLGNSLSRWALSFPTPPTHDALIHATKTLSSATAQTSERLGALEQLFAASVARVTELKHKLAKAEQDASRDALTGLANRRSFDMALRAAVQEATKQKTPLALLMVDLDHFKRINDTYGHGTGDNVLPLVGRVLVAQIKGRDIAARYGGEEFAVILLGTYLAGGLAVGEQLRRALERRPIITKEAGK